MQIQNIYKQFTIAKLTVLVYAVYKSNTSQSSTKSNDYT